MTSNLRQNLERIAWAIVGFSFVGSLGYCVIGVVVILVVEHFGWFDAAAPLSAWMLVTLNIAAYVFAACGMLLTLGASGARMHVVVPVAMILPVAYAAVSNEFTQFIEFAAPFFAIAVAGAWWVLGALAACVLVCFAASTSPRNGYGYLLFGVVLSTVSMVGLCTYAVFNSSGFAVWSPWFRLLLSCGIATTCFIIGLGLLKFFTARWPPSHDSRKTFEAWLVPLGGAAAFVAGDAVWHFAVHLLGYQSWFAQMASGFAVASGLVIAALLVLGAIISVIGGDGPGQKETRPDVAHQMKDSHRFRSVFGSQGPKGSRGQRGPK